MTLFQIAKKNILGNFKNYLLYIITMIISIVMYYTFVSLQHSSEIQKILEHSGAMQSTFMLSSIILVLFVGIFILYSNSFFMRKRKKEVGLYAIVGIPKKTIGKMLFYENLIMGFTALIIGISVGTLLSKLFSMILIKLIGIQVEVGLGISFAGVINTLIVFSIIFLVTSIQGYRLIYKYKLIELFQADRQGEGITKSSVWVAVFAMILLIGSYFIATRPLPRGNANILGHTFIILIGITVGTYLFFHSSIAYILMLLRKNRKYHYSGTNLIGTSQLLYRIKGNTRTFTMIALLSALTISFLGSISAQYSSFESSSKEFAPFSYTHLSKGKDYDEKIEKIIMQDTNHPLIAQVDIPIIELSTDFTAPQNYRTNPTRVISASTYHLVTSSLYQNQTLDIADKEAVAIKPHLSNHTSSDYRDKPITLELPNEDLTLTITQMVKERVITWDYPDFFLIVNDTTFHELANEVTPSLFKAYEVENEHTTKLTTDKLMLLNTDDTTVFSGEKDNAQIYSYYSVYQENLEKSAMNLFVIGFLGLIFLAATGSIIYFKQLTEATETKTNYEILSKIGVSRKEIFATVAQQNLFLFLMPLILGIADSFILLSFLTKFLSGLIGIDISNMLTFSIISFVIIYLGYYVLTVNTYNRIVNEAT